MSEGNPGVQLAGEHSSNERLFNALADYLRTPLVSIARSAELGRQTSNPELLKTIETYASGALRLIDGYLLVQKMNQSKLQLDLEPVVISSILYDSAHKLDAMAKAYNCSIVIDTHGRNQPVMAHRQSLTAALTSLGHVFIEGAGQNKDQKTALTFATHSSRNGMVAGVFANLDGLSSQMFTQAKLLYGKAKVPLSGISADSGVGVFVADSLFSAMSARLRVARHDNLNGLAATLLPSHQMSLV